jgi:hypothetical protein
VSYPVEGIGPPTLWFDVEAEFRSFLTPTSDPAVGALLVAAMAEGRPLEVAGTLSPKLRWNVHNTVIPVTTRQLPFLHPIRVEAREEGVQEEPLGSAILTGFSCGVDSLSAIRDHLLSEHIPQKDRVTHLLFSHVGHHGYGGQVDVRVAERWERVKKATTELGLPIGRVYSNTPEFYPHRHDSRLKWAAALTVRNSAVPLLLQSGVRRFLFASSHEWKTISVGPTQDMTEADPILLPALSTERIELCAVGTEYTRVEKTRLIADMPLAQRYLDVCIMEGGESNCSRCEKCLRTILTLELLGKLEEFEDRFDLEEYRKRRIDFLSLVLTEGEKPFHLEITEFIREHRLPIPIQARARATLRRAWRVIPHGARRRIRGLPAQGNVG